MTEPDAIISHLRTEFGDVLRELVAHVPGGLAAVLSDEQGDAIDFAHDPRRVAALDVELAGAQLGQVVLRLDHNGPRVGFPHPIVLLEAVRSDGQRGYLLTTAVCGVYVLAFILGHPANLGRALDSFAAARTHTEALLR